MSATAATKKNDIPMDADAGASDGDVMDKVDTPRTPPKKRQRKVPRGARAWGFVLRTDKPNEKIRDPKPGERDPTLWYERDYQRFLVAIDDIVIEDFSLMQFVHLVRELRNAPSQVLYKYETQYDGGGETLARRVWNDASR